MSEVGHNGGPPLEDEHVPEWGRGDPHRYFAWKRAHAAAWKSVSWETMIRRQRKAEAIGLTYEEYTLEILERGRHLGPDDAERVGAIKRARPGPALVGVEAAAPSGALPEGAPSVSQPRRRARR